MKDNPFTGPTGGYETELTFGAAAPAEAGAGDAASLIKDTTTANFQADVLQESRKQPVLVDFWAPWCGPCKQLTPVLERAVVEARGAVRLVKMNIDDHPAIAGQLGIQSIPAVIAFRDGQPVDGFMGALPESQVRDFIRKVGGAVTDPVGEALEAAEAARQAGDDGEAAQLYAAVLAQAPDNAAAAAGLAAIHLDRGDVASARDIVAAIEGDGRERGELDSVRARIALEEEAARIGDADALRRRLEENPRDHDARFDLALILNARGEREAAAEKLLEIVRADRGWRDDGARAQLVKFFEAWGPMDDATLAARRKLSSLLFA